MININNILLVKNDEFIFKRYKSNITHKETGINIYEHFITPDGYEIVLLPFYSKLEIIDYLKSNNFYIIHNMNGNEPCLFAYRLLQTTKKIVEKKYYLSLMTLFYRENYNDLNIFYQYYIDQGVDHFFMYYNGKLSEKNNLPLNEKVTYIEWDFKYWAEHNSTLKHHAQIPAMISFQKKYLPYCEYALMIDTDEFLYCPNNTIKNYLISNKIKCHLFTRHNWAKINFSNGMVKFLNKDHPRGKTIILSRQFSIEHTPSIHRIKPSVLCDIELFHNNKKQHNVRNHNQELIIKSYE
jgi:hypothetical protein